MNSERSYWSVLITALASGSRLNAVVAAARVSVAALVVILRFRD